MTSYITPARDGAGAFRTRSRGHLDEPTEAVIAEALRASTMTRVIVAHRPATVAHADRTIEMTADRM